MNYTDLEKEYEHYCDEHNCEDCEYKQLDNCTMGFCFDTGKKVREEEIINILKDNSYGVDIQTPPYQETIVSLVDVLEEINK